MTKNGNKINQLLKEQGLDWHDYGRCSLWSSKTYLATMVNGYSPNATNFHIHSNEDGTYFIDNGIMNPNYHAYILHAENVQEEDLCSVFIDLIKKTVDFSNLMN